MTPQETELLDYMQLACNMGLADGQTADALRNVLQLVHKQREEIARLQEKLVAWEAWAG